MAPVLTGCDIFLYSGDRLLSILNKTQENHNVNPMSRRIFLKGTLATSVVGLAAAAGLLRPSRVWAAEWPKSAFESKKVDEILQNLFGSAQTTTSDLIAIKAPIQAENGAVVPIQVTTKLPNVQAIGVLVEKNAQPLVANVGLVGADGFFSARVKMGQTSDVHVIVKADGKLYAAKQTIKVTVGGCGG